MDRRVAVFGAGAIGGCAAGYLQNGGVQVTVVDGWYQHVEAIKARGLRVTSSDGAKFEVPVRAVHLDELESNQWKFDVVFLAVKSYDTGWMTRFLQSYLHPKGCVVSLQNGINEERIARVVGIQRTVGCVVHMTGALPEPGEVQRTSDAAWSTYTIGALDGREDAARTSGLVDIMSKVGTTHVSDNIFGVLWAKLTLNAMSNALSGVTGYTVRQLYSDPRSVAAMVQIGGEAVSVCQAAGHKMAPIDISGIPKAFDPNVLKAAREGDSGAAELVDQLAADFVTARSGKRENYTSLHQDMAKGRRTEVDYFNGYIAALGRKLGVAARYNAAMPAIVRDVESGRLPQDPSNMAALEELAARSA